MEYTIRNLLSSLVPKYDMLIILYLIKILFMCKIINLLPCYYKQDRVIMFIPPHSTANLVNPYK